MGPFRRVKCKATTVDVVEFGVSGVVEAFKTEKGFVLYDGPLPDDDVMGAKRLKRDEGFAQRICAKVARAEQVATGTVSLPSGWLVLLTISQDLASAGGKKLFKELSKTRNPCVERRTDDGGSALVLKAEGSYRVDVEARAADNSQRILLTQL